MTEALRKIVEEIKDNKQETKLEKERRKIKANIA